MRYFKWLLGLILLGIFSGLYACALCQLYTPKIDVEVIVRGEASQTQGMEVVWRFSEEFSREIALLYGSSKKRELGERELARVKGVLLDYLTPRAYLTTLTMDDGLEIKELKPTAENPRLFLEGNRVLFSYTLSFVQAIRPLDTISMVLEDREGFFDFSISNVQLAWNPQMSWSENRYNNLLFITQITPIKEQILEVKPLMDEPKELPKRASKVSFEWNLQSILAVFQLRLKELLEKSHQGEIMAGILPLLLFSFLYGALHAAGPGHGKMLVGSYFFGVRQNRAKALFIALAIGVIHTFSAFLMTLALYYFFELFFKEFLDNFLFYATKFSALIIISIALYLLYRKLGALKRLFFGKPKGKQCVAFFAHPPSCTCGGCSDRSKSTDVGVVLGASLVPCPGTVTIFIFTMALGEYGVGFLAAFCMSMGMSLVIFGAASLGRGLKKGVERYTERAILLGECLGVAVMLFLGVSLLVAM